MEKATNSIAIFKDRKLHYPNQIPFNPPKKYPESPFADKFDDNNLVYSAIRNSLRLLNLDLKNYGIAN